MNQLVQSACSGSLARAVCACVVALSALARAASAQNPPPELTAPVNDFAGVIDPDDHAALDALIRRLQAASGDVMVIATIKTFKPEADIQTYATRMFENHGRGIGQKGRDNGLLVLLSVDDRAVRAEVGYDLEGIITDGFAGETSRVTMVPFFRNGDYGGGLVAGASRLAARIAQARGVTLDGLPAEQPAADQDFPDVVVPAIFAAIIVMNILRRLIFGGRRRRSRRWLSAVGPFGTGYGGGGWSRGGGGFGGGFGGFGGGRSGGGGGGASW